MTWADCEAELALLTEHGQPAAGTAVTRVPQGCRARDAEYVVVKSTYNAGAKMRAYNRNRNRNRKRRRRAGR